MPDDNIAKLNQALSVLIEEGRIKPGERRACLTLELVDHEDADRVAEEALRKAQREAKSDRDS